MSYEDIINLPHYVSKKRPQMSMEDRAAQFSPFAALVGFDDEIAETNRHVERFAELDENYLQELDEKLRYLQEHMFEQPLVKITYFVPDEIKEGGAYRMLQGHVKKIDNEKKEIVFMTNQNIPILQIVDIFIQ